MRKLGGFPLGMAGALALVLQASSASGGLFRGPYDFSIGPYRGGQGWSYAESYGYYGVSNLSAYPAYGYFPYGPGYYPSTGGLFFPNRYRNYDIINPAYLLPNRPPGYSIKEMAKDVILPPLHEIRGLAAVIDVKMPCFGELWVDGVPTEQLGTDRLFRSPPLEKGCDYVYILRARWIESGKVIEQTQQVRVRPGDRVQIMFPKPIAVPQP